MIYIKKHLFFFVFLLTSCNVVNPISDISNDYLSSEVIIEETFFGNYINDLENYFLNFEEISKKIVPDIVYANLYIYLDEQMLNCKVEIIEDYDNGKKYHVKNEQLDLWVNSNRLTFIYPEKEEILPPLSALEAEVYINYMNFKSETNYFVWVDIKRQIVLIFYLVNSFYFLIKTIPCSTGKTTTPTKRGLYKVLDHGTVFYNYKKFYKCYYWTKYSNNYLLHSIPYSLDESPLNTTLQKKVTHGCVRMSKQDAKWFYENIPLNTSVYVN